MNIIAGKPIFMEHESGNILRPEANTTTSLSKQKTLHSASIKIPAYDTSGKGLVVSFKITASKSNEFSLISIGNIATALKNNFRHTVEIISSLKKSWEPFYYYKYLIECNDKSFVVKDAKSSSMAMSIALFNLNRSMNKKKKINHITGTGILRIDGSFDSSSNEINKNHAAKQLGSNVNVFLTAKECNHLYDLDKLMNQY
jgi:hypothetical protein